MLFFPHIHASTSVFFINPPPPESFFNVYFQQIFCLFPLDFAYVFLLIQTGSGDEDKML